MISAFIIAKLALNVKGFVSTTDYLTMEASPLSMQRSGYYRSDGSFYYGGINNYHWSSTAQSTTKAYYLSFSSSHVFPQTTMLDPNVVSLFAA